MFDYIKMASAHSEMGYDCICKICKLPVGDTHTLGVHAYLDQYLTKESKDMLSKLDTSWLINHQLDITTYDFKKHTLKLGAWVSEKRYALLEQPTNKDLLEILRSQFDFDGNSISLNEKNDASSHVVCEHVKNDAKFKAWLKKTKPFVEAGRKAASLYDATNTGAIIDTCLGKSVSKAKLTSADIQNVKLILSPPHRDTKKTTNTILSQKPAPSQIKTLSLNENVLNDVVLKSLSKNNLKIKDINITLDGNEKSINQWYTEINEKHEPLKACIKAPPGMVYNPKTGRFIKANGKVAKSLNL